MPDKQKSINSNNPDALLKVLVMVSWCSSCLWTTCLTWQNSIVSFAHQYTFAHINIFWQLDKGYNWNIDQNNLEEYDIFNGNILRILTDKTDSSCSFLASDADNFCKQFGSRPGLTFCRAWSVSKLFDTPMSVLK